MRLAFRILGSIHLPKNGENPPGRVCRGECDPSEKRGGVCGCGGWERALSMRLQKAHTRRHELLSYVQMENCGGASGREAELMMVLTYMVKYPATKLTDRHFNLRHSFAWILLA